jgi:hypothetical protein
MTSALPVPPVAEPRLLRRGCSRLRSGAAATGSAWPRSRPPSPPTPATHPAEVFERLGHLGVIATGAPLTQGDGCLATLRDTLAARRVTLEPGTRFGAARAGHIRLNFATSPEILATAVERMAGA